MTVGPEEFRDALRKFASGVTVVTVESHGRLHGMTASSFASASLSPPRILVCLDKTSQTRSYVTEVGQFAVNVLARGQEEVARAFALTGEKPFSQLAYRVGITGAPLFEDAIAWLECRTSEVIDGGDHDIVIGDVLACGSAPGEPLVYFDRTYRSIS